MRPGLPDPGVFPLKSPNVGRIVCPAIRQFIVLLATYERFAPNVVNVCAAFNLGDHFLYDLVCQVFSADRRQLPFKDQVHAEHTGGGYDGHQLVALTAVSVHVAFAQIVPRFDPILIPFAHNSLPSKPLCNLSGVDSAGFAVPMSAYSPHTLCTRITAFFWSELTVKTAQLRAPLASSVSR